MKSKNTNDLEQPNRGPGKGASMAWQEQVPTDIGQVARNGAIFVFGFLATFLARVSLFPIASAVISTGRIVSVGQNKLVQHPTGGVVREIRVQDGAVVETGQVLLVLDASGSQAELTRFMARRTMLTALRARLEAESGGSEFGNAIEVSGLQLRGAQDRLGTGAPGSIKSRVLEEQQIEFDAGRKRLNAELAAARHQIESLKDQRGGLQTRLQGVGQLLDFTEMELVKTRPLVDEGYLAKSRLWDLDKKRLEQISQIGNLEAEIDATNQHVLEAEAKLAQLMQADREKRAEELTSVITELEQIGDQVRAAQSSVNLTELRAPQAGTIVKLAAHTQGGVVRPGEVIAEIVPLDADLETEFRVAVADIDHVRVGQTATVIITAFNRRTHEPIDGEVSYVSADSSLDDKTGEAFFLSRVRLKRNPQKNQGLNKIQAGMATEVHARAEPRVFMSYALQPLTDSMGRSFKETN